MEKQNKVTVILWRNILYMYRAIRGSHRDGISNSYHHFVSLLHLEYRGVYDATIKTRSSTTTEFQRLRSKMESSQSDKNRFLFPACVMLSLSTDRSNLHPLPPHAPAGADVEGPRLAGSHRGGSRTTHSPLAGEGREREGRREGVGGRDGGGW